jgi:hypothetical protein
LSIDEKIDYLELLWKRIGTSPEPVVVPEWHHEVISERVREIESDPNRGDKWGVVQKGLRDRLRRSISLIKHGATAIDPILDIEVRRRRGPLTEAGAATIR